MTIIKLLTPPWVWMMRTCGSIRGSGTWIKHAENIELIIPQIFAKVNKKHLIGIPIYRYNELNKQCIINKQEV
ncbi:hypothetical protein ADH76_27510 [Enterocloster clostridioformis]|nr:hypothetical protein A4V08_26390 [Lachnoclostridium sp. YL32]OXE63951.1 hypothetical protein ADH76_27510 [Enterocloster clostridioformis]